MPEATLPNQPRHTAKPHDQHGDVVALRLSDGERADTRHHLLDQLAWREIARRGVEALEDPLVAELGPVRIRGL